MTYAKGPDVMSKSARTRCRYAKANSNQTALTQFGFSIALPSPSFNPSHQLRHSTTPPSEIDLTAEVSPVIPCHRSSTPSSDPVTSEKEASSVSEADNIEVERAKDSHISDDVELNAEDWEDKIEESVHGPVSQVKGWDELRKQVKADLKKKNKTLPLSHLNQLFILSSFATLCLKGASWIAASQQIAQQWHDGDGVHMARRIRALARHYQTFEQLPMERRGGSANAHLWLHDETVKKRMRDYLTALPSGKVTPHGLQHALESTIFPDLGIHPKKTLSE